jgi:molybdopterin-guanine dinucleotide biosynthesis protein A
MDCVVVAGGRPAPDHPLFPYTQGQPKALLEIGGRPLVDFILQALLEANSIDQIVVVGLEKGLIGDYGGAVATVVDQGGMVANGLAGLAHIRARRPATRHVCFSSADIPAATGPMIDKLLQASCPLDYGACYYMVRKDTMEAAYPASNRTYVRLRDMQVAGADIFVADARIADGQRQLLADLSAGRKQAWKLARLAGLSTLLSLLTRRLTMAGIEKRATKVIGAPISVSLTDYPQLAMDVDKPEQLLLLRDSLL